MDTSVELTEYSKQWLEKAGWYPGRQVSTAAYETMLKDGGHEVNPIVLSFLREFAGLHVKAPIDERRFGVSTMKDLDELIQRGVAGNFMIQMENPDAEPWVDELQYWNEYTGKDLLPIGSDNHARGVLVMDGQGDVYEYADDEIWHVGASGYDAINALIICRRPIRWN